MRRTLIPAAGVAAFALVASACTTQGLNLRQDKRITIVSPHDREEVSLPFTLEWTVTDFPVGNRTIGGDGNYFAVFLDRSPMAPRLHLRALADESCKRTEGCPDRQWLADRFIYLTTETSLRIRTVPNIDPEDLRARDLHEITIILMDENDQRIGESAFSVEFFIKEER